MNCEFNRGLCSTTCPKYALCMYNSMQEQFSEIQKQLNFILSSLTQISCEVGIQKERLVINDANLKDMLSMIIEITNDSETKQ
jgi:hypothetical protein